MRGFKGGFKISGTVAILEKLDVELRITYVPCSIYEIIEILEINIYEFTAIGWSPNALTIFLASHRELC